jgi:hypothetical protein
MSAPPGIPLPIRLARREVRARADRSSPTASAAAPAATRKNSRRVLFRVKAVPSGLRKSSNSEGTLILADFH